MRLNERLYGEQQSHHNAGKFSTPHPPAFPLHGYSGCTSVIGLFFLIHCKLQAQADPHPSAKGEATGSSVDSTVDGGGTPATSVLCRDGTGTLARTYLPQEFQELNRRAPTTAAADKTEENDDSYKDSSVYAGAEFQDATATKEENSICTVFHYEANRQPE